MDWSYLAGFIDADGSIGFRKATYEHPRPYITATQAPEYRKVLDELYVFVGIGAVNVRSEGLVVWQAAGYKIYDTIRALRPFLIIKQDRADRVLEFIDCRNRLRQINGNAPPDQHCLDLVEANKKRHSGRRFLT